MKCVWIQQHRKTSVNFETQAKVTMLLPRFEGLRVAA